MNSFQLTAFLRFTHLATGDLATVLHTCWPHHNSPEASLLIFDYHTGRQLDFDWRGSADEVVARAKPPARSGPGRPRLGVVSTEVTLLPRHWEWLNAQPARASGTLRRLVEAAMLQEAHDPQKRREALGRILWALAGNEPQFEEAMRALHLGHTESFCSLTKSWSGDLPSFIDRWFETQGPAI